MPDIFSAGVAVAFMAIVCAAPLIGAYLWFFGVKGSLRKAIVRFFKIVEEEDDIVDADSPIEVPPPAQRASDILENHAERYQQRPLSGEPAPAQDEEVPRMQVPQADERHAFRHRRGTSDTIENTST